jgi:hypothetical protein
LSLLEAGATKNLCVLNKKLAAFKEIAGSNALWTNFDNIAEVMKRKYGADTAEPLKNYYRYYCDRRNHYSCLARRIIRTLEKDRALSFFTKVKRKFNDEHIFKEQLEPLLQKNAGN